MSKKVRKILVSIIILSILNTFMLGMYNLKSYAVTGKVNESNIRLRKEPSTNSEVVKNLFLTDVVEILGENDEWYHLDYEGSKGYMKKEFVTLVGKKEDIPKLNNGNNGNNTNSTKNTTNNNQTENKENSKNNTDKKADTDKKKEENKKEDKKIEEISKITEKIEITEDTVGRTFPVIYALENSKLKKGNKYKVVEEINRWIKIEVKDTETWILKDFTKQI